MKIPRFRLHERYILRVLVLGFSVVMGLLGAAGLLAVQQSRRIRDSVAQLALDQILVARLVHDVQAEEKVMTKVLHRLVREAPELGDPTPLLRELDAIDQQLERLSAEAQVSFGHLEWEDLQSGVEGFSLAAHRVLESPTPPQSPARELLFESHDLVMELVHGLVRSSLDQLGVAEDEIERQSLVLGQESSLLLGSSFCFAALFAVLTVRFARRSIQRIQWQAEELSRVSWHMLQTQEEVARRFSHELHDELGQSLAAMRANLTHGTSRDPEVVRADSLLLVDASIANVREISQLLRPVILDDFGLDAGLRWLSDGFSERTQIRVEYVSHCERRFADETETHLFRIAQEALTNVARHADATRVGIKLTCDGSHIRLRIEDDGQGLIVGRSGFPESSSLGMVGMRARARQCGGELTVVPATPHGLCIETVVPLRSRASSSPV